MATKTFSNSALWRTSRLRYVIYSPDGRGRDRYISFNNGGFWKNTINYAPKVEYEKSKYQNFHSLHHDTAPFKYHCDGRGRDWYIAADTGLSHDQKPLCGYSLTDFLRAPITKKKVKKNYSLSEARQQAILRARQKELCNRLYTLPRKKEEEKLKKEEEEKPPEFELRTYSGDFPIYQKYFVDEVLHTEPEIERGLRNGPKLEKYELQIDKNDIHPKVMDWKKFGSYVKNNRTVYHNKKNNLIKKKLYIEAINN